MLSDTNKSYLVNAAALLVALTIPSLYFGRASVGVTLGFAFLAILVTSPPQMLLREIWQTIPAPLKVLFGVVFVASAINIPFSLKPQLSFEAWLRTWLIMIALAYLALGLRYKIDVIFKTIAILFFVAITFYVLHVHLKLPTDKLFLNGMLLALPIVLYQTFKDRKPLWMCMGGASLLIYIFCIIAHKSKVSLLGLMIMVIGALTLFGLARFSKKQTALILLPIVIAFVVAVQWWLPTRVYSSSAANMGITPIPVWLIDLHRQLIWTVASELFQKSPWIGFGLNASNFHPLAELPLTEYFAGRFDPLIGFKNVTAIPSHPHNWLMEMLIDGGLIATVPLIVLVIYIVFYTIGRYLKTRNSSLLLFIVLQLMYWGTGLFNFSFWSTWWQASYLILSFVTLSGYLKQHPPQTNTPSTPK